MNKLIHFIKSEIQSYKQRKLEIRELERFLQKLFWIFKERTEDQKLIYSALFFLESKGFKLNWLSKRKRKKIYYRINKLQNLDENCRNLRSKIILLIGRDFLSNRKFTEIEIAPFINSIDPELIKYYFIHGSHEIRSKRVQLKAFEYLLQMNKLPLLQKIITEGKTILPKDNYYKILQDNIGEKELSRQIIVELLPAIVNKNINKPLKLEDFLEKDSDPYLLFLLSILMIQKNMSINMIKNINYWKKFRVIDKILVHLEFLNSRK